MNMGGKGKPPESLCFDRTFLAAYFALFSKGWVVN